MNTLVSLAIGLIVATIAHVWLLASKAKHTRLTVGACASVVLIMNALNVDWSVVNDAPVAQIAGMLAFGWLISIVAFVAVSPSALIALMKKAA